MQLVTKLSAKTITGAIKPLLPRDADKNIIMGAVVLLFRVYGIAHGIKKGESNFGPWVSFSGEFEAVGADGEVYRSANLFLPEVAEQLLLPVVMSDKNEGGVRFAFDIGAKATEATVGYEYVVKPVVQIAENDSLAAFRTELPALPFNTERKDNLVKMAGPDSVNPKASETAKAEPAKKKAA
jgi:hypothetical protein